MVSYFQNPPKFDATKAAFEKRYPGIAVDIVGMRASEYVTRINAENASGQNVADLVGARGLHRVRIGPHRALCHLGAARRRPA